MDLREKDQGLGTRLSHTMLQRAIDLDMHQTTTVHTFRDYRDREMFSP
jgi:hypothetical protein